MRGESGLGTCSNPKLVSEVGVEPSVRARELHCRRGWGADLWQASSDDVVLDIRTLRPDGEPEPPRNAAACEAPVEAAPTPFLEGFDHVISLTMAVDQQSEP